jgi:hypothetical protein
MIELEQGCAEEKMSVGGRVVDRDGFLQFYSCLVKSILTVENHVELEMKIDVIVCRLIQRFA